MVTKFLNSKPVTSATYCDVTPPEEGNLRSNDSKPKTSMTSVLGFTGFLGIKGLGFRGLGANSHQGDNGSSIRRV